MGMSTKINKKVRVRLESFNHELLQISCRKILDFTQNIDLDNVGIISLPTNKRIYCVLRSPHVDKDSREHFEVRIHTRIIEIYYDSNVDIFNLLLEFDLPSGVLYSIRLSQSSFSK